MDLPALSIQHPVVLLLKLYAVAAVYRPLCQDGVTIHGV